MIGPAVAEQQNVGDLMLSQEIVEKNRPVTKPAAKVRRRLGPIDPVACTDIDPFDLQAMLAHRSGEIVQQRPWRSLQEQECAAVRLWLGRTGTTEVPSPRRK